MKKVEKMGLKETDVFHAHAYRDGIYGHPQDVHKARELYPFKDSLLFFLPISFTFYKVFEGCPKGKCRGHVQFGRF